MPPKYSRYLSKRISRIVEDATNVSPAEQLQLYEELALMREAAGQSVALYSAVCEARDNEPNSEKRAKLDAAVMNASTLMQQHLKEVVSVCESAARIEAQAKDKISIHQLHYFVQQILRCAYVAFDGDEELASRLGAVIDEHIKLPKIGVEGTALTPDMDVQAMDSTVPRQDDA